LPSKKINPIDHIYWFLIKLLQKMNIIAITDLHGRHEFSTETAKQIKSADLVLIAGDLTNFGKGSDADRILKEIQAFNRHILAIPGNCDHVSVNKLLKKLGISLHGTTKKIDDIIFRGLGGSKKTPFNTPQEYSEKELSVILNDFPEKQEFRFHILISHTPPVKTKLDRTFMGQHVGSYAVRSYIEKYEPDLVICGHIHEARGVDNIKKTLILNPGPFPEHYALITLTNCITYELR
jgi:putative phosphoesterase